MVAVLRQLVTESGYSHRTLAKVLKVSKAQVGLTLLGERRIEFVRVFDWLDALDVTPDEFLKKLNKPVKLD